VTYNVFKNNDIAYFNENQKINNLAYNIDNYDNYNNYKEGNQNQYHLTIEEKNNKMKRFQNKLDFNKKENTQINVERKTNKKNDDFTEIKKKFRINSIKTAINLFTNQANGFIKEKIYFELNKGLHDRVIRKISLGGTSDTIDNLRVSS